MPRRVPEGVVGVGEVGFAASGCDVDIAESWRGRSLPIQCSHFRVRQEHAVAILAGSFYGYVVLVAPDTLYVRFAPRRLERPARRRPSPRHEPQAAHGHGRDGDHADPYEKSSAHLYPRALSLLCNKEKRQIRHLRSEVWSPSPMPS